MKLIWATRGLAWGFRFLRNDHSGDPLRMYDEVFLGLEDEREVWRRVQDKGALRFSDPEGRRDEAGRVIPHEFVIFPPDAAAINSVEDGIRRVWAEVADEFDRVWDSQEPPSHKNGVSRS